MHFYQYCGEGIVDLRLALIGLIVGVLVGFSGVGGSSLVMPVMVLVLRMQPLVAVGTDLAYSIPMKLFGAILHQRQQTVDWNIGRWLIIGGVPSAGAGILMLIYVRAHIGTATINLLLQRGIGWTLFTVGLFIVFPPLLSIIRGGSTAAAEVSIERSWQRCQLIALGAIVGFLVSLTSIGGGSLTLPLLYLLLPQVELRRLVGTDVVFAACLVPLVILGHLQMGTVNFALAINLTIGSLPGVFIGSKLCKYAPNVWFRPTIAIILLVAGIRMV